MTISVQHVAWALLALYSVGFYYQGKSHGRRECNEENLTRLEALADTQYNSDGDDAIFFSAPLKTNLMAGKCAGGGCGGYYGAPYYGSYYGGYYGGYPYGYGRPCPYYGGYSPLYWRGK